MTSEELRERVAALKHDLAKYVAWTSANLGDELWQGPLSSELVEALRDDILCTRRGRGREGAESAWEVWESLSADLPRPLEGELRDVERAVDTLRAMGPLLQARDPALAEYRNEIRAAQQGIRRHLRSLHRRLMQEVD